MVKRDASSQEALDRSPKRTQLIEILSDSDSELPDIGFSRLSALSQRARVSTQGKHATARDSWLVKPQARRVEHGEEYDDDVEPGLELMNDQADTGRQATVESDRGEVDGYAISNVRRDSSPLMAQSEDPRPASRTSDTRDNLGDAEPSAILDHAIDSAHSVSARQTPTPAEAIATKSPTVDAVDTYIAGQDRTHPTSDAFDHSCEAGPSHNPEVATTSSSSSGLRVLPAFQEAPATNCPTLHESNSVVLTPVVGSQSQAEHDEAIDEEHALQPQDHENSVENEPHRSEQPLEESDDSDDDDFAIKGILGIVLMQLSKYLSERITEEQNLDDSGSEQGTQQSIQDEQSARSETHAGPDVAHERRTPSSAARKYEPRDRARCNATLPLNEATQGQPSHPQVHIRGNMRFTNCDQMNIGSHVASWEGISGPDGGLLAPLVVEGDVVFEGCKVVNILTPPTPIPAVQRLQNRSHRPRQRRPEPQPHSPRVPQHRIPLQHPLPAPPVVQHSQPKPPLRTFAQPHPPTQLPTQPQSYGSTLQFHTHDPNHSQAFHAGPSQAHTHAQPQHQQWPQTHFNVPPQSQAQVFHDLSRNVQQIVSGVLPQAYPHPPRGNFEVRHPARGDQAVHAHREAHQWGRQDPEEYEEMEEDENDEYDEDDDGSEGSGEYYDDEEFED